MTSSGHGDPAYFVPRASLKMLCLCYVKNGLQSTEAVLRQEYYWKCRPLFSSRTLRYPKRLKMKSERSVQGAGEVWGEKNNTDWEYFGEGISGRGRSALGLSWSLNPSQKFDGVQPHLSKIGLGLFLLLLVSNLTTAAVNLPSTVKGHYKK